MNQRLSRWAEQDQALTDWLRGLVQSPFGRWTALLVAHSGDGQWWLAAGFLLWWRAADSWRAVGIRLLAVTLSGALGTGILKRLVRRPRPQASQSFLYLKFDRHSFPSGHAARTAGMAVVLGATTTAWVGVVLAVWGLAVGVSRVALGVHFASDIAAGWVLGGLIGCALLACGL